MWDKRESATTTASAEPVWGTWADVEHWSAWNKGVKWSRRDQRLPGSGRRRR